MDQVAQFSAVTGASELEANNWLEMSGFVLEDALQLFFESGGQSGQDSGSNDTQRHKRPRDDPYSVHNDEDNVRLPDQVKMQKLVDTDAYLENQNAKRISTAFSSGKNRKLMSEKEKTLSEIFQAPLDIMTQTRFEEAKELAKSNDKWLLVNIQKDSEFACHALNRDFWSDECIKDMVICSFTFWQKLDVTPEGQTYISYYKVHSFPHLAIIDPRTGAKKWEYKFDGMSGFDKKKLAEKLQDFLGDNASPSECRSRPGAKLAPYPHVQATFAAASSCTSTSSGVSSSSGAGVAAALEGVDASEDPELAAAIRMSLQQSQQQGAARSQDTNGRDTTDGSSSDCSGGSSDNSERGSGKNGGGASADAGAGVSGTVFSMPSLKKAAVEESGFSADEVLSSGADTIASSEGTGAAIRAQFRLPGGAKATEKFSTEDDVLSVVRAIAQQLPAADASKRFDVQFDFPRRSLSEALKEQQKMKVLDSGAAAGPVTLAAVGVKADMVFFVTFL